MSYHFSKTINQDFDTAISKVTEELKKEGFGVLTEIDVKDTLKKKLAWIFGNIKFWAPAILTLLTRHYWPKAISERCFHAM